MNTINSTNTVNLSEKENINTNFKITEEIKKKVLLALYYYDPYVSWLTIYAKNLAQDLALKWYDVTVFCAQHEKDLPLNETINWVKVIREKVLFNLWKWVIMPFFWLKTALMARKMDAVNLHFPNADLWLSSLFIKKEKLFVTYHCDINLWAWFVNKTIQAISFFLMNIALKRAKNIVWNSKSYFEASYFKKYIDKFVWIYPPIDFKKIWAWTEATEIPENDWIYKIWFLWRIVYEKWINFLLEALLDERLKDKNFHLYLWWDYKAVRWGSVMWELSWLIEQTKDKITFLWNLNTTQLKDFFSKLDVLVLPSIDPLESFWMVQVESMFNNTPVIASNMPWVNEVVNKTGFGYLTIPKSSADLAIQIEKMIQEKEKYRELRKNNTIKETVLKDFATEKTVEDYIKVFKI